ncbi:hypothetical protein EMIHUDRAFT_422943 [Emiliania huxleyi CCMP1516]|uniref:KH type-2 domain-containing protein n=2 Tax=Emiliania huxleyi TaxID=2903 RepID=A0A0D3KXP4_EMIH1|nr:hypothetical protein EMIHUDRAFT_422943 [Emiliania huxleyi CCMP1516]EOD40529.1 hypothetical protein EMIHUDRAFT_422943 [Emiliania huxleyi CCMP1516]|eukprot:XP_005792958.1 hypothetical protein EMIHUDRAFT_422943 [Emiliania huxleyi CCMP1516]
MTPFLFLSPLLAGVTTCPAAWRGHVAPRLQPVRAAVEDSAEPAPHRAGFVSIIGMPNVGKSTLMNRLVGERLAIMTPKAGTTRHRILGILNGDDYQLIYSDTPGIYSEPQCAAHSTTPTWCCSCWTQVEAQACPLIVLLNKVDLLRDGSPLPQETLRRLGTEQELLDSWQQRFPQASVLPVSAETGEGTEALLARVRACLPLHEPFFPKDQLTDRPERFFAAEMLREAIFTGYRQEVPYSCEVAITAFKELDEIIRVKATIFVSHETQQGIVIGRKGAALKAVGSKARKEMEAFFCKQVYLQTSVKVRKDWRQDPAALRDFGYTH